MLTVTRNVVWEEINMEGNRFVSVTGVKNNLRVAVGVVPTHFICFQQIENLP